MTPDPTTPCACCGFAPTLTVSRLDPRVRFCDRMCRDASEPLCHECRDLPQCPDRADGYCSSDCADVTAREAAADRAHDEWRDAQLDEVA